MSHAAALAGTLRAATAAYVHPHGVVVDEVGYGVVEALPERRPVVFTTRGQYIRLASFRTRAVDPRLHDARGQNIRLASFRARAVDPKNPRGRRHQPVATSSTRSASRFAASRSGFSRIVATLGSDPPDGLTIHARRSRRRPRPATHASAPPRRVRLGSPRGRVRHASAGELRVRAPLRARFA